MKTNKAISTKKAFTQKSSYQPPKVVFIPNAARKKMSSCGKQYNEHPYCLAKPNKD